MSESTLSRSFWADSAAQLHRPQALAGAAVLAALHLILNQFTVVLGPYLQVGFDFLTVGVTGFLFGPWVAGLSGILTDILGYVLRPAGPFFPGWTLSALLMGMLYGALLYRRPVKLSRIIVTRVIMVVVFNFFLTPLWLHMLYGEAFVVLSGLRVVKNLIKFPIDVALLYLVLRLADREVRSRLQ